MIGPVHVVDAVLRRAYGIFDCSADPNALFRLRRVRAQHLMKLDREFIAPGAELIELHVWNEHWPRIPHAGPDLSWGKRIHRLVVSSLRDIAAHVRRHPSLAKARAIGGPSVVFSPGRGVGTRKLLARLGFIVIEAPRRLPVLELADRLYLWRLVNAYQPVSASLVDVLFTRRVELWIPMDDFIRRYGAEPVVSDRVEVHAG